MRISFPISISNAVLVLDSNLNIIATTSSLDSYRGEHMSEAHYLVRCHHGNPSKVKKCKSDGTHIWVDCPTPGK